MTHLRRLLGMLMLAGSGWLVWEAGLERGGTPAVAGVLYASGVAVFLFSFVFDVYMGCISWAWPLAGLVLMARTLEPGQDPWLYVPALIVLPFLAAVMLSGGTAPPVIVPERPAAGEAEDPAALEEGEGSVPAGPPEAAAPAGDRAPAGRVDSDDEMR